MMWYRPKGPYIWRPELRLRVAKYKASMNTAHYQSWWPTASLRIKMRWRIKAGLWSALWLSPDMAAYTEGNIRERKEREAFLRDGTVVRLPAMKWECRTGAHIFHYHNLQHRGHMLWATDLGLGEDLA